MSSNPDFVNPDQPAGDPEWGYRLNFEPGSAAVLHEFAGEHDIAGGGCPNCDRPLTRLLSLNSSKRALNLDSARTPVVHLLYCWTCSIPFGEFAYRMNPDGSVELLRTPERQPDSEHGPEGPYDGYTGIFPIQRVSLEFISEEEQHTLKRYWQTTDLDPVDLNIDEPRHQVGGYPFISNPQRTTCPICSCDMPLLAAICNDASGNNNCWAQGTTSFVGNGGVQMIFHLCRRCSVVSAYSSCD